MLRSSIAAATALPWRDGSSTITQTDCGARPPAIRCSTSRATACAWARSLRERQKRTPAPVSSARPGFSRRSPIAATTARAASITSLPPRRQRSSTTTSASGWTSRNQEAVRAPGPRVAWSSSSAASRLELSALSSARIAQRARVASSSSSTMTWRKREAISRRTSARGGQQPPQDQGDVAGVEAAGGGEDPVMGGVELGELVLAPGRLPRRLVGGGLESLPGERRQGLGTDGLGLQGVDPAEQAGQQAGRVAADLVVSKRQLLEPVEQHRQPLGRSEYVEERVEAGLRRVVAEQALPDRLPGADPELLVGTLQKRLGALPEPRRGGAPRGDHQDLLGSRPLLGEPRQPPGEDLGLPGPGCADQQQRALVVGDGAALRLGQRRLSVRRPVLVPKAGRTGLRRGGRHATKLPGRADRACVAWRG